MPKTLEVTGLSVGINKKKPLKHKHINRERPNICSVRTKRQRKTSLLMTIMGFPNYKVKSGKIFFEGKDIIHKTIDERARMGIGMGFQLPQDIRGVKLIDVLRICAKKHLKKSLQMRKKG